ncbi:glutathione-dependent formaldehyde-activating GFA [Aspergillus oryzae]|uniref:Glutathione-dependent formaldehyde-activating GFA n=1 Tax=Aspergillus oryzae TaxID=5062 RepID=A0A1S9DA86_ASPOZ|nr:glutathione-dependent formaldehyde-activating GFA [Aspergillus oryzae]
METAALTGTCACEHITYTASVLPTKLTNCHCTTCRKQSGGPYQTWALFSATSITWTHEEPTQRRSSDFATRGFCPRCGSSISMVYDLEPGGLYIAAGTIDDLDRVVPKPCAHFFVKEKAAWFQLPNDGFVRFSDGANRGRRC